MQEISLAKCGKLHGFEGFVGVVHDVVKIKEQHVNCIDWVVSPLKLKISEVLSCFWQPLTKYTK